MVEDEGSSPFGSSSVVLKWLRWVPNFPATFLMVIMEDDGGRERDERVDEDERNATRQVGGSLFNKRQRPNNASRPSISQ